MGMRSSKNNLGRFAAVITTAALLTTVALTHPTHVHAAADKAKPEAVVSAKQVHPDELFDLFSYPARVEAKVNTTVLAEADGVVTRILAPLGQKVSRSQVVLRIAHTDPVYKYAPMEVRSPVGGIVSGVDVSEGSQVTRGQKLVSVTDPAKVRIALEAPALDLPYLGTGMKGEFNAGERSLPVAIRGVSPFVDPATGTASIELEVDAPKSKAKANPAATATLPPGLAGQVSFKGNLRKGFSIPEDAITYRGQDAFVRTVVDGKAQKVPVTLGRKQRGQVEVLKGLKDGMTVVMRASRFVADGEAVKVQAPDAAGQAAGTASMDGN